MPMRKLTIEEKTVYFGHEAIQVIPSILCEKNFENVFICTDASLMKLEIFESFIKELAANNISFTIFGKITPNPKVLEIRQGVMELQKSNADCVIAFGGGSVLDAAKLISLISVNEGDVIEYSTHWPNRRTLENNGRYSIGIPTTSGSGSEMDGGATVINEQGHKISVGDTKLSYNLVIEDPSLTYSCPKEVMAACAFDAFCHSFESLLGDSEMVFSSLAKESINLIYQHLLPSYRTRDKGDLDCIAKASFLSGCVLGFEMTTHGLPIHSIGLPLAEKYNISHGQSLAWVAPHIIEFIIIDKINKVNQIAEMLGIYSENGNFASQIFLSNLKEILKETNLVKPKDFIITERNIEELADMACHSKTTTSNGILPFTKEMCKEVYKKIADQNWAGR